MEAWSWPLELSKVQKTLYKQFMNCFSVFRISKGSSMAHFYIVSLLVLKYLDVWIMLTSNPVIKCHQTQPFTSLTGFHNFLMHTDLYWIWSWWLFTTLSIHDNLFLTFSFSQKYIVSFLFATYNNFHVFLMHFPHLYLPHLPWQDDLVPQTWDEFLPLPHCLLAFLVPLPAAPPFLPCEQWLAAGDGGAVTVVVAVAALHPLTLLSPCPLALSPSCPPIPLVPLFHSLSLSLAPAFPLWAGLAWWRQLLVVFSLYGCHHWLWWWLSFLYL